VLFLVLGVTVLVEGAVYATLVRKGILRLFGISTLVNCLTNPVANMMFSRYPHLTVVEGLVILSEAVLLMMLIPMSWKKALLLSFLANLVSFAAGIWLFS